MNQNMNAGCGGNPTPCAPLEPIIMPCKTCVITKCHPIEQPVICPSHTHIVHRYVPYNRYYYQSTMDEETQCPGQANQDNNFGM